MLVSLVPEWAALVAVVQDTGEPADYLRLDRAQIFAAVKAKLVAASAAEAPLK